MELDLFLRGDSSYSFDPKIEIVLVGIKFSALPYNSGIAEFEF